MLTSALFGAKKLWIFRNLWCVRTDKGGGELSQCGQFVDKEGGTVNFLRFCACILVDRLS